EMKARPAARHRLERKVAAHELDVAPGDRETEPRAARLAATAALLKRLEDAVPALLRDAGGGVVDLEPPALVDAARAERDEALLGELHRVAQQVDEDLAQLRRIPDERDLVGHAQAIDAETKALLV